MPHVIVQYREGVLNERAHRSFALLQGAIRKRASVELSTGQLELTEGDFSFMFLREGPHDSLTKDVQVIILAHAFPARVETADPLAQSIGDAVFMALRAMETSRQGDVTFSVSLCLSEMGYYDGVARLHSQNLG